MSEMTAIGYGLLRVPPIGMDGDVENAPGYRFFWEETKREWKTRQGVETTSYDVLTVRGPGGWSFGLRIGQHKSDAERRAAVVEVLKRIEAHQASVRRDRHIEARERQRKDELQALKRRKRRERRAAEVEAEQR